MGMRIDKFLKVSRLIKRRELAKDLCDDGDIFINGKVAKPSSDVDVGDELFLILGRHRVKAKVLQIRPFAKKEEADSMYAITEDEIVERRIEDD